jgi:hypothetical protein
MPVALLHRPQRFFPTDVWILKDSELAPRITNFIARAAANVTAWDIPFDEVSALQTANTPCRSRVPNSTST